MGSAVACTVKASNFVKLIFAVKKGGGGRVDSYWIKGNTYICTAVCVSGLIGQTVVN